MRVLLVGLIALSAYTLSACAPEPATWTGTRAEPRAARQAAPRSSRTGGAVSSSPDVERGVHAATNRARQREGAGALGLDRALSAVARRHSADMARRDFFDHHAPDGSDATARAARAGLTCRVQVGRRTYSGYAENLAQVWTYSRWTTRRTSAGTQRTYEWRSLDGVVSETVDGWMRSPGHRRNLLLAHATREGIGVSIADDGAVYVTQMLC